MRITAKVDYAVRAAVTLARHQPTEGDAPLPMTRQAIADDQDIPAKFLEHILSDLKREHNGILLTCDARNNNSSKPRWIPSPSG